VTILYVGYHGQLDTVPPGASSFAIGEFPMRKVFLSHSFADRDRALVTYVESLLRSHGLIAITGRNLGGGQLTPEVARLIEGTDAMIALFTQRENEPPGVTHPWVLQEFGHARLRPMPAIGMYETGVPLAATDAGFERIDYSPPDALPAFVRLSETIGEWKRSAGRLLKVMVMPTDVAQSLGARADRVRCECRFLIQGEDTAWQTARVRREIGGVFVFLRVPDDVEAVQIRMDGPPAVETPYTPLWPAVQFELRN
jgi:hypothetical protein